MKTGIYRIVNLKTGRSYIGSARDLNERKTNHFSQLRTNKHHSIILQRAYNKALDKNIFEFQILELCLENDLIARENFYLETLCKSKDYIDGKNKDFLKLSYNILPLAIKGFSGRHRPESIGKSMRNNPNRKEVNVWNEWGAFLGEYLSIAAAGRQYKVAKSAVKNLCEGSFVSKNGYIFGYKGDTKVKNFIDTSDKPILFQPWNKGVKGSKNLKNSLPIRSLDSHTNITVHFSSQLEACEYYKLQPCTINRCLKSGKLYKKYLKFEYL